MASDIFYGDATVPESGYSWTDGGVVDFDVSFSKDGYVDGAGFDASSGRYLIPIKERGPVRKYDPLQEYSGLFRDFGDLEITEPAILGFTNRYGWLGCPERFVKKEVYAHLVEDPLEDLDAQEIEDIDALLGSSGSHGESLTVWRKEIGLMRQAVALWQSLRRNDIEALGRAISMGDHGITYDPRPLGVGENPNGAFASPDENDRLRFGDVSGNDPRPPALICLRQIVERRLSSIGAPSLRWTEDLLAIRFRPTGLLSTLWLQFARAIEGNKEYERCKHCLRYFEIGPTAGRKGKAYCSDACRSAAYRLRKSEKKP